MNVVLRSLARDVAEACADTRYSRLKGLWSRHNQLDRSTKVPVCVFLHKGYTETWRELIAPSELVSTDPFERDLELQLRQKLYRYHHIPDDTVVLPTVTVTPPKTEGAGPLWGADIAHIDTSDPVGAYGFSPAVATVEDLARFRIPAFEWDRDATAALVDRARELVGDQVSVVAWRQDMMGNPGEKIVEWIGWEAFLLGLIERPDFVHAVMSFLTDGMVAYHRSMEAAGLVRADHTWHFRVHYDDLPANAPTDRLESCWIYITAQTTGTISPDMYAEFIQPYNEKIASLFGRGKVYYHGCEDLGPKIDVIRRLPGLRRFHVSPWTDLPNAVDKLGDSMVLECHVNPATTTLSLNPQRMRSEIRQVITGAGNACYDINLSDIQTVGGHPRILTEWARIAQEETALA
jgi:hypothetical protein